MKKAIIIIIIVSFLAGGAFLIFSREDYGKEKERGVNENNLLLHGENGSEEEKENDSGQENEEYLNTRDWQTYINEKYSFEIKYPSNWTLSEKDDKLERLIGLNSPEWEAYRWF